MVESVKKALLFMFLVLSGSCILNAQETDSLSLPRPSNNATMIGFGHMNLYDTYLSPLEYKGWTVRLVDERMKQMSWFNNKVTRQQTIEVEYATTENPAKNAKEYWFMFSYSWGGHYNLFRNDKFRFSAGAIGSASVGILYNERNSNNPASARAYANLNLSVIAFYQLKNATFRWQMNTPVAGILFSPHYGQSYYEISLGNTVGTANFASLHNQLALRNYLTVDFPVSKITLRLGYLGSYYQTKVHELQTHTYSHSFVIGLVNESINLSGHKSKKNKQIKSCYYFND